MLILTLPGLVLLTCLIVRCHKEELNGSQKWKDPMREFVQNTTAYLEQYHQRSNSEAGFAAYNLDWVQRRDDSALFCIGTIYSILIDEYARIVSHNLTSGIYTN